MSYTREELLNPNSRAYQENFYWKRPNETIEQYLQRTQPQRTQPQTPQQQQTIQQKPQTISSGSMIDTAIQKILTNTQLQEDALRQYYSDFAQYSSQQERNIINAQQALRSQIAAQFEQRKSEIFEGREKTINELEGKMSQVRPYGGLSTALEHQKASIQREYDKALNQLEQLKSEAIAKVDVEAINQISALQRDLIQKRFELMNNIFNLQNQSIQTLVNLAVGKENIESSRILREEALKEKEIERLKETLNSIISPLEKIDINKNPTISSSVREIANRIGSLIGVDPNAYYESIRRSILEPEASQIVQYSNPNTGESGFYRLTKRGTIIDKVMITPPINVGTGGVGSISLSFIDKTINAYLSSKNNQRTIDKEKLSKFNIAYGINLSPEDLLLSDEELKKKISEQISSNFSNSFWGRLRQFWSSTDIKNNPDYILSVLRQTFGTDIQTLRTLNYDEAGAIYGEILSYLPIEEMKQTQLDIILNKILAFVGEKDEPLTALGKMIKKKHVGEELIPSPISTK